jgi:hypothetical protein
VTLVSSQVCACVQHTSSSIGAWHVQRPLAGVTALPSMCHDATGLHSSNCGIAPVAQCCVWQASSHVHAWPSCGSLSVSGCNARCPYDLPMSVPCIAGCPLKYTAAAVMELCDFTAVESERTVCIYTYMCGSVYRFCPLLVAALLEATYFAHVQLGVVCICSSTAHRHGTSDSLVRQVSRYMLPFPVPQTLYICMSMSRGCYCRAG